jgi:predicted RNase H-like HicB family nuclease
MKRTFTASIAQEGDWYVAQCVEVDVASQGETEEEAVANLGEALELHFTLLERMRFGEVGDLPFA